jgi:hypothetical protein
MALDANGNEIVEPTNPPTPPKTGEFFEMKDPVTGEVRKLPKELEPFMGHVISKTRKETEGKYKPLIDDLNNQLKNNQLSLGEQETLRARIQELEEANMSAEERAKLQIDREKKTWEDKHKKAEQYGNDGWNNFYQTKIDNDLFAALGKHDLYNPDQTKMILKTMGGAKVVKNEESGKFETKLTMLVPDKDGALKEQVLSPQEAVDKFLALPENANHLKASLRPGGGAGSSKGGKRGSDGAITFTRQDLLDPAKRKEYNEKLRNREPVHIVEN